MVGLVGLVCPPLDGGLLGEGGKVGVVGLGLVPLGTVGVGVGAGVGGVVWQAASIAANNATLISLLHELPTGEKIRALGVNWVCWFIIFS